MTTVSERSATVEPPPWREVFAGQRGRLTLGLLLLEALVAMEALIVAVIMPAVEDDLGGLALYGWAFTAFMLASLVGVPIAGRLSDRLGPRKVLSVSVVVYATGLVIAALAPTMFVLVVGRFVQGFGGGGVYTASMATVAKAYEDRFRPRVMALLASMWVLPGLLGPPLGGVFASTVGWRWAFVAPIPAILLGVALVVPAMRSIDSRPDDDERLPVAASLVLMLGTGIFLAALTEPSWLTLIGAPVGLAIGIPALLKIVPRGTFRVRPGIPAAAVASFLTSFAFIAVDAFLTLMLHDVRGLSIGTSGLVISGAAVAWAVGTWWQSRLVVQRGARWVARVGAWLLFGSALVVSTGLVHEVTVLGVEIRELPIWIAYVGWAIGGLGMGIVWPTIPVSVMGETTEGREAGELSSTILMDFLGLGIGAGLGGVSVAAAAAGWVSLRAGVAGAFLLGVLAALALVVVVGRIPDRRPVDSAA
ncbi:MAG TPA: MFS transporter [Actinomycetota bacterium]|nr:MFS transporter [Actinomycetota bacterium]